LSFFNPLPDLSPERKENIMPLSVIRKGVKVNNEKFLALKNDIK